MASTSTSRVVGLEIGTRFAKVAQFFGDSSTGHAELVVTRNGERETPCYYALSSSKEALQGESAFQHAPRNERTTAYDLLRIIGLPFAHERVAAFAREARFGIVDGGAKGVCLALVDDESTTPAEALARNLAAIKEEMEDAVGVGNLGGVVLALPSSLLAEQRDAVLAAVAQAGLTARGTVDSAVAAALAAGLDKRPDATATLPDSRLVLVLELGVEFRATLLRVYGTGLISTVAARHCWTGGDQIDELLLRHFADDFQRKERANMMDDRRAAARLRRAAEQAKRTLSQTIQTTVDVESLYDGADYAGSISRGRFELICSQIFQQWQQPVADLLASCGVAASALDGYLLAGGCSAIPAVRSFFDSLFPSVPLVAALPEAAALGAALQAKLCEEHGQLLAAAASAPVKTAPRCVGVETADGAFLPVFRQGQPLPCTVIRDFVTTEDQQAAVVVRVADDQKTLLGRLVVDQLPPAPKGAVSVRVLFRLDQAGDLQLIATVFDSSKTATKTLSFVI